MENQSDLRAYICEIGRRAYAREMGAANDGNISVMLDDGTLLCTPTGVSKGFMTPDMICRITRDGTVIEDNGRRPSSEIKMHLCVYDHRDDAARLTRAVAEAVPLFRDMTDFTRSNLAAGSRKLFAFSNLHTAVATLVAEAGIEASAEQPDTVVEFWEGVIDNMPDWTAAGRREVACSELRRDTVHAHGVALEAIAVAGARAMLQRPDGWRSSLGGLRGIDWSRANTRLWEGRALVGGRVNRSRTSVMLTADLISRSLEGERSD